MIYTGSQEERAAARSKIEKNPGHVHVLVCSFDTAIRDFSFLKKFTWATLVVDEAHRLKNASCLLYTLLTSEFTYEMPVWGCVSISASSAFPKSIIVAHPFSYRYICAHLVGSFDRDTRAEQSVRALLSFEICCATGNSFIFPPYLFSALLMHFAYSRQPLFSLFLFLFLSSITHTTLFHRI